MGPAGVVTPGPPSWKIVRRFPPSNSLVSDPENTSVENAASLGTRTATLTSCGAGTSRYQAVTLSDGTNWMDTQFSRRRVLGPRSSNSSYGTVISPASGIVTRAKVRSVALPLLPADLT